MHPTPAQAGNNFFVGHIDFNDLVDLDPGINQRLGLRDGAGKAVKEKSIDTVFPLPDQ